MRFRLRFTRGPAAEFSVADDLLQQSPETRLSRLAAAAVEAGDSRVELGPVAVADNNWAAGTVAQIRAWYGDNKRTLRPGVELQEWVAIAQWLELPAQGRLESLSYEDSQEDGFAREMRARLLLKSKSDVVLSVAHIKQMMRAAARRSFTFGFLRSTDDATYVNRALANPLVVVGVATGSADAARYGTPDDAFNWAEDEDLRADAKNRIEHRPVWKAPPAHG